MLDWQAVHESLSPMQYASKDPKCGLWAYLKWRSKGEPGRSKVHIILASSEGWGFGQEASPPWEYDADQLLLPCSRTLGQVPG